SEPSTDDPKDPDDPFDSTPLTPSSTAYGHNPVTPPRYPEASDPREPVTPTAPEGATPLRQILQAVTAPPPPPMSPAKRAVSTLHERCAQMRIGEPVWSDQKEGRDNNPIFTVTVRVDAHVTIYGEGKAGKKQVAKELAAQAALDDPGWSTLSNAVCTPLDPPTFSPIVGMDEIRERFPLPEINSDDLRNRVFTHRSVTAAPARQEYDDETKERDNERLVFLGAGVIHLVATVTIEELRPLSRRGDLTTKRALLVSQSRLAGWSDAYRLPARLRAHQSQQDVIPHNEAAKAQVFQAYVGALFKENSFEFVSEWLSDIVEHTINGVLEVEQTALVEAFDRTTIGMPGTGSSGCIPSSSGNGHASRSTASPSLPRSPTRASSTQSPPPNPRGVVENNASALARFNERCTRNHIQPQWTTTQIGPQHAPTFRATVTLPGEPDPIGMGEANTKVAAKQAAAEMALLILDQ
ncbi:hypothetical protein FRC17_007644, partial [Serendipita sp. 399]